MLVLFLVPTILIETRDSDLEAASNKTITLDQILDKRKNFFSRIPGRETNRLVNILIVPGHDDEHSGTEYKNIKEVELNRQLAQKLYEYLSQEDGINPVLASDESGYNPIFESYFQREESSIKKFIKESKNKFERKVNQERFNKEENNFHNVAPDDVIYRLYGINRWVNDRHFDLVIHVHFNDYAGRKWNRVGKYEGFSIYTPGRLFDNHNLSRKLANSVFAELKKIRPVSNLEKEQEGIIEDHELIAVGANESLEAGSILVEYGYIYEDVFINPIKRDTTLDYLAYATYSGFLDLLGEKPKEKGVFAASIAKYKTTKDNLLWQFEKALDGQYPPSGKTLKDCPISGFFGDCSLKVK